MALPTGAIIAYAGDEYALPVGWYLCNGKDGTPDLRGRFICGSPTPWEVSRTKYFSTATKWTEPGGKTMDITVTVPHIPKMGQKDNVYKPDLRGLFVRGVNHNSSADPDAALRRAPDGTMNAYYVGTLQGFATYVKRWMVSIPHFPKTWYDKEDDTLKEGNPNTIKTDRITGPRNVRCRDFQSKQHWSGFAKETRPDNAAVNYYIAAKATTMDGNAPGQKLTIDTVSDVTVEGVDLEPSINDHGETGEVSTGIAANVPTSRITNENILASKYGPVSRWNEGSLTSVTSGPSGESVTAPERMFVNFYIKAKE
ncbi:hypothetical protein BCR34DRAFT_299132 [Clohesyomyces aquaticus]|uniref:Phage tail collar domain-containing protein n=1 Tax=Clohesyomyces aquaticus TaxID=1231657 RepID=A0A1Y1ZRW5_9PLEO|nr:hypothetical protein BCR34DRAFT_299132 [Clohesyomyces aquaticus]